MLYTETLQSDIDLLELHKQHPARYPHLLQSSRSTHTHNRYDILFACPRSRIELWHDGLRMIDQHLLPESLQVNSQDNFLEILRNWCAIEHCESTLNLPFVGGWFLYMAYEFAQSVEKHALNLLVAKDVPIAFLSRFEEAIIYDREKQVYTLVSEKKNTEAIALINRDIASLATHADVVSHDLNIADIQEDEATRYIEGVNKIKRYIKDGDIFQVNLSRQWTVKLHSPVSPAAIYQKLRRANPAPFAGLMTHPNFAIASSSPERLVSDRSGKLETRPIAGTRPRDKDKIKDQALMDELSAHPKEKAEHIMLIDLERNDLGRVCKPGTIDVDELMSIESFEHVHHLVSNVVGQIQDGVTPDEVIKAVFPGGTITGCPKVRCMQILRELEQSPRESYTGSMGYLNVNGDMDLNILIRGIQIRESALTIRAGAGIVSDSIAHKEVAETRSKAKGMLAALGVSVNKPNGLLETFRVTNNCSIPLWSYHKARLKEGLKAFGIKSEEQIFLIEKEVFDCIQKPGVYRLAIQIAEHSVMSITLSERDDIKSYENDLVWSLLVCNTKLSERQNPHSIKLLQRDIYQQASTEITAAKIEDGLLLNEHEHVIETSMCNVFCVNKNVLYTPKISGGVAGVMRCAIQDYCERKKIELVETDLSLDIVYDSDAVFLCNAARGVIQVDKIGRYSFQVNHEKFKQIKQYVDQLFLC